MGGLPISIRIFQKGFNFSQDGPGNRLVYHLQGCNMRCPWCANPEGMALGGTLLVNPEALLESACPHGAIRGGGLDRAFCARCAGRECLLSGTGGVALSCFQKDPEELVREALDCRPLFFDGGGVTLTGGEPTCQLNGVKALLEGLKRAGIHTALETNGTHPRLPELFPLVDYFMMDLKHWDSETHKLVTGVGNETVLQNLNQALKSKRQVALRIPLIGGFNAGEDAAAGFLACLKQWDPAGYTVEILPFHEFGRDKWARCGLSYEMTEGSVPAQRAESLRNAFYAAGIRVIRT